MFSKRSIEQVYLKKRKQNTHAGINNQFFETTTKNGKIDLFQSEKIYYCIDLSGKQIQWNI